MKRPQQKALAYFARALQAHAARADGHGSGNSGSHRPGSRGWRNQTRYDGQTCGRTENLQFTFGESQKMNHER